MWGLAGVLGFPILSEISPPAPQPTQARGKPLGQGCAEAFAQQLSRDPGPKSLGSDLEKGHSGEQRILSQSS